MKHPCFQWCFRRPDSDSAWLLLVGWVAVCFVSSIGRAQELTGGLPPEVQREIRYAEALNDMKLPDYARLVLDRIQDPAAKPMIKVQRMRALASRGQWEQVKAIIAAEPDRDSQDVWAMKLTLADNYYAWGKYPEAQDIYESLFAAYPDGPPPALNDFYVDSSYRYARMLLLLDRHRTAVAAYDQILKAKLSQAIRRQVLVEKAEALLKRAEASAAGQREVYLEQVESICEDVLWVQDLWFGKAIVLLAHVQMIRGDPDRAMELVDEYWAQLKQLDEILKQDEERSGDPLMQLSPMAECRYLLGVMMHEQAEALLAGNGAKEEIIKLLVGTKKDPKRKERTPGALQHLLNVFIRYADTSWAPDAGIRAERIEEILEGPPFNATIQKQVTPQQMKKVERLQFQGARLQFTQNRFKEAAESYERVLNLFPESEASISALAELACCYVELGKPIYAETVVHHLVERFSGQPAYSDAAGDQVLRMATFYTEHNLQTASDQIVRLFLHHFPHHPRATVTLFRLAEERFKNNAFPEAIALYQELADQYPESPLRVDALSRIVTCHSRQGDPVAGIKALQVYIGVLEKRARPGHELIAAKYREAMAYKELGPKYMVSAFNRLFRVEQLLTGADRSAYEQTAAEKTTNDQILQAVLYHKAACYIALPPPDGKSESARKLQAIETLEQLVRDFPGSEFAPSALSQIGTLWIMTDRPVEAGNALQRLQEKYPDSPEAGNALFMRGMNLLKMDRKRQAMEAFKEMFSSRTEYSTRQVLSAGTELMRAGELAIALDAFNRVLESGSERNVRESALLQKGSVLIEQRQFAEATAVLDTLRTDYPRSGFTVEACLHQGHACSELGVSEPDPEKRIELFNRAIEAMNQARKFELRAEGNAQLDVELARILRRKAEARARYDQGRGAVQDMDEAIAIYQKLILFGNRQDPGVRSHIETAYNESIPLLFETERWQDVVEDADRCLDEFPDGRFSREIRDWRSQARVKLLAVGQLPATNGERMKEP